MHKKVTESHGTEGIEMLPAKDSAMSTVSSQMLQTISSRLLRVLSCDCATLDIYNSETGVLVVQFLNLANHRMLPVKVRLPLDGSPAGTALKTMAPVILERIQESPFAKESVRHLTSLGMQSGCWIPLVFKGNALGTMSVARRIEGAVSREELEMLLELTREVAAMLSAQTESLKRSEGQDRSRPHVRYSTSTACYLATCKR